MRFWPASCFLPLLFCLRLFSQDWQPSRHISSVAPVQTPHHVQSAERVSPSPSGSARPRPSTDATSGNNWRLFATLSQALIHDVSFPSALIGYAAGEHGQVWKTTDGGKAWTLVLNADTNDYYYGVDALTNKDIIISGFYDSSAVSQGIFRWSHDGGKSWTGDLSFGPTSLQRVRFVKENGIIMDQGGGNKSTYAQFTTDGGHTVGDWSSAENNPDGGWFDPQFSFLLNLHARASGINFCSSLNAGAVWSCNPSVDSVFDGPVYFLNDARGWVGGGEIYPNVEGWIHRTTNGGKTWSDRVLDGPWPIRSILFLNATTGWASGGNFYTGVGGVFFTTDGGQTWSTDLSTGAEMGSCTQRLVSGKHQIWCAGFAGTPSVYSTYIYSMAY